MSNDADCTKPHVTLCDNATGAKYADLIAGLGAAQHAELSAAEYAEHATMLASMGVEIDPSKFSLLPEVRQIEHKTNRKPVSGRISYRTSTPLITIVRLFGTGLLITALGACTTAEDGAVKAAIIMLVGGIACIFVREGVPRSQVAVAAALIVLSLAIVGNSDFGDKAAVAVVVVAVVALRKEPLRCSRCDSEEPRSGRYCANCGCVVKNPSAGFEHWKESALRWARAQ